MLNFNVYVCVCVGGGGGGQEAIFVLLYYIMLICSNSELNTRPVFCQTNRIWKNIFIDNILTRIFSYSILKVNLCTSRRTQLQQKLEMSVSLVILS